jgi:ring-1,2-phenylacetyl-CoA epoxidase subunit PaaE
LKAVLEKEPESKISLYYGNFSPEATIFKSDLDGLAGEFNNRLSVTYVFEKAPAGYPENLTGNLNPKLIENILKGTIVNSPENEFFICGPVPMMDNVKGVLEKMKVNPKQVHIEYFTSGSAEDKKEISTPAENVNAKVTVIMYGLETTFNLNTKGPSILDKALEEGVDVPYACKGAVCCTCRAKVVEGKVSMRQNFALTDEEVAQGFILTCQSHPITPEVKVDYDS